ncbi:hypothetical protein GCK32_011987 [Trichostrongylus colubriformis]|uniref:Uncharacterized protein n=1 Tax=Trichostrongylus colubriformis TaxID=6319 RepID=A0AAN8FTN1_TRICO
MVKKTPSKTKSKSASKDSATPPIGSSESSRVEDKISRTEFLCAAVAFAIGSGNLWLVPASIAQSGLTFLIQFTVCYVLAAIPLYYMEVALGQYTSASPWCIYQMLAPAMSGVPAAMAFNIVLRSTVLSVWVTEFLTMFAISLEGAWREPSYARCSHGDVCYDHRLARRCMFASPNDTSCAQFISAMVNTRVDAIKATPLIHSFARIFEEPEITLKPPESYVPNSMVIVALMLTWICAGCAATVGARFIGRLAYAVIAIAILTCIMLSILGKSFL